MILLYHKIYLESPSAWWVDADNFYRQMYELQNKKVVLLDDYDPSADSQVVITFDGIYKNVLEYAAPILNKFNYPFELFIVGDYVGKDNQFDDKEPYAKLATIDDLAKLVQMGGRLQWHTKTHPDMSGFQDISEIKQEISVPQHLLAIDPKGFKWFAFPYGNYTPELLPEVKKRFRGSLACHQGDHTDKYTLKRQIVTNESRFTSSTVAVIVPSYNYGAFLVEAIESVLRQTILPDEVLIADDCSDDSTQEIAMNYQSKYPELIRYCRNHINLGVVRNFSKAVGLTSSDYIALLGADNRFLSNYIEETKKVLDSSDKIGIAYTDFALFGPRAKLLYDSFYGDLKGEAKTRHFIINFPEWDKHSKQSLAKRNFIHGSSMYKRKAYEEAGGYKEDTQNPEDYDLFLRMIKNGWEAKKAHGTFLEYRQHSRDQRNIELATYSELMFYKERYRELLDEKKRLSTSLLYKMLIPLIFCEKAYFLFKQAGAKALFTRALAFLKRKLVK